MGNHADAEWITADCVGERILDSLISGDDPCTYCGLDLCECDRLAADQNDDYESLVY